ncbi:hypothetical protein OU798_14345 [Prolixibacteraceae bacterium Z1-6]|uniref:Uncharacterized protein n=1 Tax=Draconibacterium aestuarii TaxID=2998507 RepID=A0A9X3F861_9BACT|nr:hypothetical protein [Prolixibacteraceae bacterium Z1-6]
METWSKELNTQIDAKLEGVNDKDLRFYRIEEFKRNITRINSFSNSCPGCKKEMQPIRETVEDIDQAINDVGRKRKDYDQLISQLSKHMQKEHGFYAPYYFTYMYSFFGIVAGAILGYILMNIDPDVKLELFCSGFAIGILPPYIIGYLKDKKIRSAKKLM